MRRVWLIAPAVLAGVVAGSVGAQARGDARAGEEIANRWCATCHIVSEGQERGSAAVPTFMEIAARSEGDLAWLDGFLADPHPMMPDMSLTRQEIQDLVSYIASLR
ncbi:c-type cytochrome [Lutibaculum baratangense]|uniref:Cytochrome c552 n=1 Tax=Lutibaculum baratangense AMV1 TaxID=631454 RepID=V4RB94_9HYPH|nr:c-type cytochrome [Lutibaculum baratangense]ESR23406.1 cytochrome c552 [Lutibaculum baratangense AMV1]